MEIKFYRKVFNRKLDDYVDLEFTATVGVHGGEIDIELVEDDLGHPVDETSDERTEIIETAWDRVRDECDW